MKQKLRKNNNINIWVSIFLTLNKREIKEENGDKMFTVIIRMVFLLMGVFSVSTFFGGITDNIMVAVISAIIAFIVAIIIAVLYRRKTGKPIVR